MAEKDSFKKTKTKSLKPFNPQKYINTKPTMNEIRRLRSSLVNEDDAISIDSSEEVLMEREPLTLAQRRKRGLIMKRFKTKILAARERAKRKMAPKEKLLKRSKKKALDFIRNRLMKNKKYSEMTPAEKIALDKRVLKIPQKVIDRIAKRLFPKVRQAEVERLQSVISPDKNKNESKIVKSQDPDVSSMPGSQPSGYYAGVKKSVKDDRARHFAKYAKKSDDVQSSYKPAPGDKGAKTEPSIHTKRFRQMFNKNLDEASRSDIVVRKRPHMAFEKNGSVKFDKRFKMYRPKNIINESFEDFSDDLTDFIEDLDSFIMSEEFDVMMENNPKEALKKKAEKSGISYGVLKKVFDRGVAAWRTGHRPGTTPTQWGLARVNSFATKSSGTWGKADSDLASKVKSEAVSPTAVHPFVHIKDPNKAVKVSSSLKHKLGIGLSPKHMMMHGLKAVDIDNDGDVDSYEKKTPDEITGTEKKNLTRLMQKKYSGEVKHSRIGHAFESVNKNDPQNREDGTDSLVRIYKKDTPGQKPLKEFMLTNSYGSFKRGDRIRFNKHSMGMFDGTLRKGTVIGGDVSWLRVRDDKGMLFKVRHYDAVAINESTVDQEFDSIDEQNNACPLITQAHMNEFEKLVNRLFDKFGIEIDFTKHFRERMSDSRNNPCIDMKELAQIIRKIYAKYQRGEKSLSKYIDSEAVIKDMQTDLNMPIAVEYDRKNDTLDVVAKTIMRKKNFRTPDPEIKI